MLTAGISVLVRLRDAIFTLQWCMGKYRGQTDNKQCKYYNNSLNQETNMVDNDSGNDDDNANDCVDVIKWYCSCV